MGIWLLLEVELELKVRKVRVLVIEEKLEEGESDNSAVDVGVIFVDAPSALRVKLKP